MVSSALAAVLLASCEGPIVAPPGPLNGNNDGAASDAAVVPFVPFMPRGPGGPSGAAGMGGMPGGSGGIDGSAGRGGADGGVPAAGMLVKEGSLSFLDLNFTASGMSGDCRRIIGSDYNGGFSPGYVWTDGGANPSPIISLGHLAPDLVSTLPSAISADGSTIIGSAQGTLYYMRRAFRWTTAGLQDLGFAAPNHDVSSAFAVSVDGKVVAGTSMKTQVGASTDTQAFVWIDNGGLRGLGFLPGDTSSRGLAMTPSGSIVIGVSRSEANQTERLFSWNASAGLSPLMDGIPDARFISAFVSDDGSFVAGSILAGAPGTPAYRMGAFRWTAKSGLVRLVDAPAGRPMSSLSGLSADGSLAIGLSHKDLPPLAVRTAFTWSTNGHVDVLPAPPGASATWPDWVSADGSVIIGGATLGAAPPSVPVLWDRARNPRLVFAEAPLFSARCVHFDVVSVCADTKVLVGTCQPGDATAHSWIARFP